MAFLDFDVFNIIKLCEHVIMQSNFKTKEYSIRFYMQFDCFEFLKMLRDHFLLSHIWVGNLSYCTYVDLPWATSNIMFSLDTDRHKDFKWTDMKLIFFFIICFVQWCIWCMNDRKTVIWIWMNKYSYRKSFKLYGTNSF